MAARRTSNQEEVLLGCVLRCGNSDTPQNGAEPPSNKRSEAAAEGQAVVHVGKLVPCLAHSAEAWTLQQLKDTYTHIQETSLDES